MEKPLSPLQLRLSQQVFLWVDMIDFVKVGRSELDQEILSIIFQAENSGEEVFDSIDLAKRLCSPLITLNVAKGKGARNQRFKISFIHHTAAQFVRQSASRKAANKAMAVPTILRPQALKALYRGTTSVRYFEESIKCTQALDSLRSYPSQPLGGIDTYFEMAYGLWNALFLETLPDCLDDDDLVQASILCSKLTEFLLSRRCLRWVEMAIIINYDGGFTNLFENVIEALCAAEKALHVTNQDSMGKQLTAFQSYSIARRQFFADYAYVIFCTGPTIEESRVLTEPDGFSNRPVATDLMLLGQKWTHLYSLRRFPPPAGRIWGKRRDKYTR
ncbi:hypothetical protein UA08_00383 [Talaromyces atroroseus]|uniref:Uncharacterized protein n=1 Tax=Talaromyces atroroseus TaxID=1441469 RepID=A0A225B8E1_TALAT|nr:hypothetical protein UA08_00383 [Talaromyces atroroseus]OKL63666.1 hypothetical protein UA08_00383 [Talaromyces atroroseus]